MNGAFGPDNYDAPKKSAVVTLSFGGNDVGFFQGVTLCVLLGCQQAIQRAEKEVKEETEGGGPARFGAILHVEENIKRVREDLRNIFKEIPEYALRGNVTTEKVFVVGYAPVFPLEPDVAKGCQGANNMNPTKAAESLPLLAKWEEEMQTAIEGAVEEAKSGFTAPSEIKFVDTSGPFKDHDVCQPKGERWIFGREGKLREGRTKVGLWHPNAEGAKAMAEALEKAGIAKAATEPFSRRARDGASRLARRSSRAAGARTAVSRPVRARAESVGRVVSAGRARAASSAGLSARAVFPFESMSAEPLSLGTLSGTVTDAITGSPIEGVCVYADSRDGGSGYGSATTASDGTYTIEGLPAESYVVEFYPCGSLSSSYVAQFYDDTGREASATPVAVTAAGSTEDVNAALQRPGTISGTVTDAVSGSPVEGVCVYADSSDGGPGYGSATTASDGTYTIHGLAPESYVVEFYPCGHLGSSYLAQFYDDATDEASATAVAVTAAGSTEGIGAALQETGTISGTVTDAVSGSPVEGACVDARASDGGSGYGSATTASDGTYTIVGLATGSYVVEFSPCEGSSTNYLTQFYDDATDEASATAVSVTAGGGTVGIDAALQQSATISGTVTDAVTGEPIEGVCVYADPSDGGSGSGAATTASDGTYTIDTGLATGSYVVEFSPCEGSSSSYSTQFYDGATSESSAKAVNVTAGASTESIDAALQKAGTISGSVSEAAGGSPLARVCVRAFSSDGTVQSPISVTSSTGTYTVADLPAGSYDVYFDPTCQGAESSAFLAQWSGGASKLGSATAVSVTAGGEATGVNAALVKPASVYGSISGTVTGAASGKPLASVCVTAISSGEGEGSGFAETAADGTYTITGLPAHGYYLDVDPSCGSETNQSGYVAQWSGGASSQQSASVVSVTAGATTSANTALEKSGSISGTVIDAASGKPIEGVCVTTWPGGEDEAVTTAASGTYTIEGLTPGTYYVEFDPTCPGSSNQNDLAQWYDGASEEDANAVTVTAGAATANINASLQTEGPTPGCTGDTGTIKLSPGMTNTAAVQTMEIKGALTGCTDAPFTGASYTATLHSATAVSCSALNAGGEIASGSSSYKWTPKTKPSKATGTLSVPLSETPGVELSGTVAAGPHSPLELSGTLTERYTGGATCGVREGKKAAKPVKKGTFTGSAVRF
jgi:lysophospholipase L1-like esterase